MLEIPDAIAEAVAPLDDLSLVRLGLGLTVGPHDRIGPETFAIFVLAAYGPNFVSALTTAMEARVIADEIGLIDEEVTS